MFCFNLLFVLTILVQCLPRPGADAEGALRLGAGTRVPDGLEPPHLRLGLLLRDDADGGLPLLPPRPLRLLLLHCGQRGAGHLPTGAGGQPAAQCRRQRHSHWVDSGLYICD